MTHSDAPGYHPTTTHAEWGAGDPRLTISRNAENDGERIVFHITEDRVQIGSAESNAVVLEGTDPLHATIVHDDRDEYVLTLHGVGEMNANPEAAETGTGDRSEILRTGAHFTAGEWRLVFAREEFADHGRPYGGREGGELSDQPGQPARPDYHGTSTESGADYEVKHG